MGPKPPNIHYTGIYITHTNKPHITNTSDQILFLSSPSFLFETTLIHTHKTPFYTQNLRHNTRKHPCLLIPCPLPLCVYMNSRPPV
ncbi:hypothetical protein Hanom_Chr10g00906661 [Helianthus anomalus]